MLEGLAVPENTVDKFLRQRGYLPVSDATSTATEESNSIDAFLARRSEPRGVRAGLRDVAHAIRHPKEAIKGIVGAATRDAYVALAAPEIGEESGRKPGHVPQREWDQIQRQLGRPIRRERVTEATPNAVTRRQKAGAALRTGANVALVLAPATGLPARAALNAAGGAINVPEDPLRGATAGVLLGEGVRAGGKAVARGTGAAARAVERRVTPDIENSVDRAIAEVARESQPKPRIVNERGVGRIPRAEVPRRLRPPVEPGPDAKTVSFGGRVKRRPAAEKPPEPEPVQEQPPREIEPAARSETGEPMGPQHFGGRPPGMPEPVASADGIYEVRPGVTARVNRELGIDSPATPRQGGRLDEETGAFTSEPNRVGSALPGRPSRNVKAISIELERARNRRAKLDETRVTRGESPEIKDAIRSLDDQIGALEDERAAAVRWRYSRKGTDELVSRYAELEDRLEQAQQDFAKSWRISGFVDENMHMSDGRGVYREVWSDNKGLAFRAKGRIDDDTRALAEIEEELQGRGVNLDELRSASELLREERARQAADEASESRIDDSFFGFGEEPDPVGAPREYLNYAKFGLDQTAEARVRTAVERGRAEGTITKEPTTFVEQRRQADAFAKKILANPLEVDPAKLRKLSGAEIVGLHTVVGENTRVMEASARVLNDGNASAADLADAQTLFDRATQSTDEVLSAIVREKAATARGLGFFRQVARQSTDPDVWLVNAKRMYGDRPLPDSIMLEVRRLAREAAEACVG
jgi:hypothetical protein